MEPTIIISTKIGTYYPLTVVVTYLLPYDTIDTGANISPSARCRMAADRMPFADDVTALDAAATWRSAIQDGGMTSQSGRVVTLKLWSLPNARRARVVNALKGI